MTETEILERIRAIFKENFAIEPGRVTPQAHLYEDLDLDSIDAVDLAIKLGVIFRLAAALNRSRSTKPLPGVRFSVKKSAITIRFPHDWLDAHPLTRADLEEDAARLLGVGVEVEGLL